MKKKLLSGIIAMALIISSSAFAVMAEDDLKPATRAQALVNIIKSLGKESATLSETAKNPFDDVPDWADKYVAYAFANGITKGVSDTKFDSDSIVSAEEYAAFLSRAAAWVTENNKDMIKLKDQGIFSSGGITVTSDGTFDPENQWEETGAGQTAHVDHANVLYQIPEIETGLPMVFLHGYGQSRMGWMTTPDGREGWSDMFLKYGHSVFLIDEPRRGEAGGTSVAGEISTKTLDQRWYTQFRIGRWENGKSVVNEGSQFPNDDKSVDQFFRQMTPDTGMKSDMGGDFDNETVAKAVAATIDEAYEITGKKSILVTHSQGGGPGWTAAQYTDNIAAIIAIEPGGAPSSDSESYNAVTSKKIPVIVYFGDYIDNGDEKIAATGMWQGMRGACYVFAESYTAAGGNATVIDLPKIGIYGNDHFMFQDLNNDVIAEHVENWINENVK